MLLKNFLAKKKSCRSLAFVSIYDARKAINLTPWKSDSRQKLVRAKKTNEQEMCGTKNGSYKCHNVSS
jgi:hypothetical protein